MTDPTDLFSRHASLAHWIARDYFIPGAEYEDVHQEALIGLWDAAVHYDPTLGTFQAFAGVVIRRHLMDTITTARRGKRAMLTNSVRASIKLTPVEREALARVVNGVQYASDKSLNNALQRARRKLKAAA